MERQSPGMSFLSFCLINSVFLRRFACKGPLRLQTQLSGRYQVKERLTPVCSRDLHLHASEDIHVGSGPLRPMHFPLLTRLHLLSLCLHAKRCCFDATHFLPSNASSQVVHATRVKEKALQATCLDPTRSRWVSYLIENHPFRMMW